MKLHHHLCDLVGQLLHLVADRLQAGAGGGLGLEVEALKRGVFFPNRAMLLLAHTDYAKI